MKMPSLSTSDLQPLPFFLHTPPLLPPPSEPNFHNFQLVGSGREGKQENRTGQRLGSRIQCPSKEFRGCPCDFTVYLIVAYDSEMLGIKKKKKRRPSVS
jgi:hypothetical protein